jgi:hypothetical protein
VLVSAIALVIAAANATAAQELFDNEDAERGYYTAQQTTETPSANSRWCVPSADSCDDSNITQLPATGPRVASVFPNSPYSNEE